MQAEHVLCGFSVMTMIDNDELRKHASETDAFSPPKYIKNARPL